MISNEQIERAYSELRTSAREAFEKAKSAERALETYTYSDYRQYDPAKRERLLAEYREADYLAESRAWISSLIREFLISAKRVKIGIPHDAVCFFKDGDKWCCVYGDFANLQVSPAGFGDTFEEALDSLKNECGQRMAIRSAYSCNGNVEKCERERFGGCDWHDGTKNVRDMVDQIVEGA